VTSIFSTTYKLPSVLALAPQAACIAIVAYLLLLCKANLVVALVEYSKDTLEEDI